ncbi:MAG: 50S ribosomal protein L3 N(5)-glutamine methyltransferase [Betaproteobacteria bacterium]|nr:50S ribosomal protein L3 N(5)-glutamine methyltransferase [Betaproteobacteria bacterium]MDH5222222.1 50S ribosomal protein L3 N(5)-glutamine methyltransferase [Betaproteobacteria bacterium]MDH5350354.1 50S ribosomal protein L3 N(5)-glutamine methyltransferase [Betaproteobacteria bacterium]
MTLRQLVSEVARALRAAPVHFGHGTTNAGDEAAYLVLRGLGLPFDAPAGRPVSARERARIARLLRRRIRERVPVAYLLREAWLAGEPFYVDRRVIIPRSHIAELLQRRLRPWRRRPVRSVLDLCTGSGCLAVLAAKAFARARVDAADLSPGALSVAGRNIARHRLRGRIRLVRSDLMAQLGRRRYDLILSNPPYVDAAAMRALPREYRLEPRMALAAGADGLDLVRRIIAQGAAHLEARGLLVCEIGAHRRALERAFPRLPFAWPQTAAGTGQVFLLSREDLPRQECVG